MAATAYSSLISLMNVLTRYQHIHPTCPVPFDQSQIQTLLDKVSSLVEFLENYYDSQTKIKTNRVSILDLERKMTRAANAAEDIIETFYLSWLTLIRERPYDFILFMDIKKAIQEMDEIIQESMEVRVKKHKSDHSMSRETSVSMPSHQKDHETKHNDSLALTLTPTPVSQLPNLHKVSDANISTLSSSFSVPRDNNVMEAVATNFNEIANTITTVHDHSSSCPRDKDIMVGFDEQLDRLMNRIRVPNACLKIIPIVGMGGIGKTTLAANVYNSKYARHQFDIRAWVMISQQYVVRNILVSLLHDIKVEVNDQMEVEVLGDKLHKGLYGRRYLIVVDDIWDIQGWNEMMRFFPDNGNGSRILLTTRVRNVANGVGQSSTYEMKFLNDDESFDLLSKIVVYSPEVFPRELEILGKKFAKSCKGLPLAVVVIGGLLKTCSKTLEHWNEFAENLNSVISKDNGGQCLEILSLSYSHLPIHLKPCFLYMATFQEDERIDVSNLINLWIAEGFLKPTKDVDQIALEYLTDLIDRNLIMVAKKDRIQKIETVSMHDLVRELCLEEAKNEGILCVVDDDTPNLKQRLECERRIVYKHNHSIYDSKVILSSVLHARSLHVTGNEWSSPRITSLCGLSRVINFTRYSELETDIVKLVNIRYLAVYLDRDVGVWLCCSLPLFRNLETLILYDYNGRLYLPYEIWEFPHLRHLEFKPYAVLPDRTGGQSNCVLKNLQTIRGIKNLSFTDEVIRRIPNLKELSIEYDKDDLMDNDNLLRSFTNLALLPKLEILKAHFFIWKKAQEIWLTSFSPKLVELELKGSRIPWEDMTIVGCLPNLQVLVLVGNAFCGNEWNSIEGEFQSLKDLSIDNCRLSTWNAESCHFPRLEHLGLFHLGLKEIPLGIGDIQSLESIQLKAKEILILKSAKKILEDRRNNQGDDDDLVVTGYYDGEWSEEAKEIDKWAEAHKKFNIMFYSKERPSNPT